MSSMELEFLNHAKSTLELKHGKLVTDVELSQVLKAFVTWKSRWNIESPSCALEYQWSTFSQNEKDSVVERFCNSYMST